MEIEEKYMKWLTGNDTGISSRTMFASLIGIAIDDNDIPSNMRNIGRCVRMLRQFPELRKKLTFVIKEHIEWMPFIDCWKELEKLYDDCILSPHSKSNAIAWNLIQCLSFASRYLRGMRIQNNSNCWSNKAPDSF